MSDADTLQRFLFDDTQVRGELVHLDAAWRAVLERHPYPATVLSLLGEALAATVLLTGTLKFAGALIVQVQGAGPLRTLVAQATHGRTIRGLARWEGEVPAGDLNQVFGSGRLVLTLEPEGSKRYQGVVALDGTSLAQALEGYFGASEQLATRLWLVATPERAAGLLLQYLPGRGEAGDDWTRVVALAETLSPNELIDLPSETLLHRLFHEENLRLFEPEPVAFRCTCSRRRIEETLRALGQGDDPMDGGGRAAPGAAAEVDSILADQGAIEVSCEFCNRAYQWDRVDAQALFTGSHHSTPAARH